MKKIVVKKIIIKNIIDNSEKYVEEKDNRNLTYKVQELNFTIDNLNKEIISIKESFLSEREKFQKELEQQKRINKNLLDNEVKRKSIYKRNRINSYFRGLYFMSIYITLLWLITVGKTALGAIVASILALIYVFIDILLHNCEKKYNFWQSYKSLLIDLIQTIAPTVIIGGTLFVVRDDYREEFINFYENNIGLVFDITVMVVILLILPLVTVLLIKCTYFLLDKIDKATL